MNSRSRLDPSCIMPSTSSSETWRHRIGWAKVTLFTFSWRNVRPKMQQSFTPLPSSVAFQMFNTYIANEENGTTKDFANKILSNQGRETLELWWQIRKCHILCLKKVQPAVVFTLMPHSWFYNFSWDISPLFSKLNWWTLDFSLLYQYIAKQTGDENKENDQHGLIIVL